MGWSPSARLKQLPPGTLGSGLGDVATATLQNDTLVSPARMSERHKRFACLEGRRVLLHRYVKVGRMVACGSLARPGVRTATVEPRMTAVVPAAAGPAGEPNGYLLGS